MKETTLFLVVLLTLSLQSLTDSTSTNSLSQWQLLTEQNFSSLITLNPHILLIVSTPWSGESRSLMKEITEIVTERKQEFSSLKLMQMYGNKEKMLAKSIGVATEDVTVIYFRHSLPYSYNGKIRAKSILFSIGSYLSVSVEDVALNVVRNEVEFREFAEFSDKSVILFEFCGWTRKVLASGKSNGTESDIGSKGAFTGASFDAESNGILMSRGKENPKVDGLENVNLKYGDENELAAVPWVDEFSSVNDSTRSMENDTPDTTNGMLGNELSCTFEEFQKFDSFFTNFMNVAREFFLPPIKHRFGIVSDRSLLSSLGVGDVGSWSVMLYFSGCPSCSKTLKEGENLRDALKMGVSIVRELEGDGPDLDPAVPSNRPSVLLFVDRSSELLKIREKSKEALVALRELASQHQISHLMDEDNGGETVHHTIVTRHPKLKLSLTSQKTKLKDKVSVMNVNEGKHAILEKIASDLQGSSLQEILTRLLQQKKEAKLSSVAKEVGFQLLSGDLSLKLEETSLTTSELESEKVSVVSPPPEERFVGTDAELDKGSDLNHNKKSQNVYVISSSKHSEEKTAYSDTNQNLEHLQSQLLDLGREMENSEAIQGEENKFSQVADMGQEELPFQSFKGSFFFSDGNYRLLEALTGETRIPSLVIIDPILQEHYVLAGQSVLSYSSVENFIHAFLNRSIVPYQRSKSRPKTHREEVHPPFVNLDFNEAGSIPRVTFHTFSEQVLGLNPSDNDNSENAWKEDVVVLFSNSWCGFCQRMELIVREVYRAIKGYASRLKAGSMDEKTLLSDIINNGIQKIPKIFLMDCTLNDCNFILKSVDQREVYPSLLLFPAERKTVIPYEGDLACTDIIKFIANQGSYSQHLTSGKGIVWTPKEKRERNLNSYEHLSRKAGHNDAHACKEKDTIHEVLLKNIIPNKLEHNLVKPQTSGSIHGAGQVAVGSILIASEKINTQPFDNSMILIVKADENTGFQGLIYNKPIGWDAMNELSEKLELLKEAPLSFGGPLVIRITPLVALTRRAVEGGQYPEVAPGIYYLSQVDTLREIEELKSGNRSPKDFWFFLGFSRWGWNQLYDEIAGGGWILSENRTEHLSWPL